MSSHQENNTQVPDLTIAEKAAVTYFEANLENRIFEPDMLVGLIHTIIGDNKPLNTDTPMKPSDDLAQLLINLLRVGAFSEVAQTTTREAIECCFLHSPVYQLALKLYYLEHENKLKGTPTAYEVIQQAIDSAYKGEDIDDINEAGKPVQSSMQMPQASQKVIRANRFELIDEDGEVCAELYSRRSLGGEGRRSIFSMDGKDRRRIHMVSDTQTGEMAFGIFQGAEYSFVNFGVYLTPGDPHPMLEIGGRNTHKAAYMHLTVDDDLQSPAIKLYDRKDKLRAVLKVLADGTPVFELKEPKAKNKGKQS